MDARRLLADEQVLGDLLVGASSSELCQHLDLARRQAEPIVGRCQLGCGLGRSGDADAGTPGGGLDGRPPRRGTELVGHRPRRGHHAGRLVTAAILGQQCLGEPPAGVHRRQRETEAVPPSHGLGPRRNRRLAGFARDLGGARRCGGAQLRGRLETAGDGTRLRVPGAVLRLRSAPTLPGAAEIEQRQPGDHLEIAGASETCGDDGPARRRRAPATTRVRRARGRSIRRDGCRGSDRCSCGRTRADRRPGRSHRDRRRAIRRR